MNKLDYLKMLIQDNETEKQPTKELHESVIECTIEALSQSGDDTEVDQSVGLGDLFAIILMAGKEASAKGLTIEVAGKTMPLGWVSPFAAAELIAQRLGVEYKRPFDVLKARFCAAEMQKSAPRRSRIDLDDL